MNFETFSLQQGRSTPPNRRRNPYLILAGILLISFIIVILIINHNNVDNVAMAAQTALHFRNSTFNLEHVLSAAFYPKIFNGTWIDDTQFQYMSTRGDLMLFSALTNESRIVIPYKTFTSYLGHRPYECKFSPSQNSVLVSHDPQKIYRHSIFAFYVIYNIKTRTFAPLWRKDVRIQLAVWAENDNVAFVAGNDVYFYFNEQNRVNRVTHDGSHLIYNGVTDWVYEEEMFSSNVGVWGSVNNLAYVTFNDTNVDSIQFTLYGEPGNPNFQYPIIEAIPYPKSGRTNPTATVTVHHLNSNISRNIILPNDIPQEHYIGNVKWLTSSSSLLLVTVLNRHQNESWILICDEKNEWQCRTIRKEEEGSGWLDVTPIVQYSSDSFLTLTSTRQGNGKSFKHVTKFNLDSLAQIITRGLFHIDEIFGVNQLKQIYVRGTLFLEGKEGDPSQSHLYRVDDDHVTCLTCQLGCTFNHVAMSKDLTFFAHTCNSKLIPTIRIFNSNMLESVVLESNLELEEKLSLIELPRVLKFSIPIENNLTLKVKLFVPHDLDHSKKYPILIDVYGGPGSQKVSDKMSLDWGSSLVSSKNIIYGSIDGRGSGRQSDDLLFSVYRQLGTVEIQDQIHAVKWLIENLEYIDKSKVGIWGWSYGGFVTAMVLATDNDNVFRCGISVAPVTNWAFYDTIYTERYMGLPVMEDNYFGYNVSDVTNYVDNFKGKKFLLVHGNADDNVHYQQSMVLARALQTHDILFRQQSYPDESHGLGGVRRHLYHTLEDFLWAECFS